MVYIIYDALNEKRFATLASEAQNAIDKEKYHNAFDKIKEAREIIQGIYSPHENIKEKIQYYKLKIELQEKLLDLYEQSVEEQDLVSMKKRLIEGVSDLSNLLGISAQNISLEELPSVIEDCIDEVNEIRKL